MKTKYLKLALVSFVLFASPFFCHFAKADNSAQLDDEEKNFINLLNEYRRKMGRSELKATTHLNEGAEYMAEDMANHPDSISSEHIDSKGGTAEDRGNKFGYYFLTENIGWGYETGQGIFDGWKESKYHNRNMTAPEARTIGVARVYKADAVKDGVSTQWYWAAVFSDEGVERLKGNNLKDDEMYFKGYKKMNVTVKKNGKLMKWAEIDVYDQKDHNRLIDRDLTDSKGRCTLYTLSSKAKVKISLRKFINSKKVSFTTSHKLVKSKKTKWKKKLKLTLSYHTHNYKPKKK